jgi:hypothetical protein
MIIIPAMMRIYRQFGRRAPVSAPSWRSRIRKTTHATAVRCISSTHSASGPTTRQGIFGPARPTSGGIDSFTTEISGR